ncbi:UNVERIFIED_ORG: hypothetical protein [Escherichia phage CMSTMSU]
MYYNDDRLDYSIDSFIEDILNSNTEDMLYEEYLDKYKERMSKLHADAPVLNISKLLLNSSHKPIPTPN